MSAVVVYGRRRPRRCSWCDEFFSPEDRERAERGEKVSHGICPDCEQNAFPEDDRNERG